MLSRSIKSSKADIEPLHQLPGPSDLNSLSHTCKTLKAIVVPKLYRCVSLRVPQQLESQYPSRNLSIYTEENLKYTRGIVIEPQQHPRDRDQTTEWSQHSFSDDESHNTSSTDESHNGSSDDSSLSNHSDDESNDVDSCRVFLPSEQDSNSLNRLVRVIIARIPRHQLHHFV